MEQEIEISRMINLQRLSEINDLRLYYFGPKIETDLNPINCYWLLIFYYILNIFTDLSIFLGSLQNSDKYLLKKPECTTAKML